MFDIESIRDSLAENPQDPIARSALTSWIATDPAREDLLEAAERVAADYEIVKPILDVLLVRDPKDVVAWERLAAAAYLSGFEEEADMAIDKVLALDPNNERGLDLRLSRMNPLDNFREAEPIARQMYATHPKSLRALSYLVKTLLLRREIGEAESLIENFATRSSEDLQERTRERLDELRAQARNPESLLSDLSWP